MKLFIAALITVASTSSFALTTYGEYNNADLTTININEYTQEHCESALAAAQATVKARNKFIVSPGKCTQVKGANTPNWYAFVRFHKYL